MNDKNFLPENYTVPENENAGSYMKFQNGENRFRVLSSAVIGYECWKLENGKPTPVRGKTADEVEKKGYDRIDKFGNQQKPKHFWAFVVYNYKEKDIEILEVTQKRIMSSIQELVNDSDWGNPKNYDVVVFRKGEGMDTEYTVQPKPAKELDKTIKEKYEKMNIDLTQLYDNGDPFNPNKKDEKLEDLPF